MAEKRVSGLGTGWCRFSSGTNTCSPLLCLCLIARCKASCPTNNLTSPSHRKDEQPNLTVLFSGGTDLFDSLDVKHPVSLDRSRLWIGQCMVAQSMLRLSSLGQQHSQSQLVWKSQYFHCIHTCTVKDMNPAHKHHPLLGLLGCRAPHYTENRRPGCSRLRYQVRP